MNSKYILIRIYYLDKNTEVIICEDEKELRDRIMEDFEGFDLAQYDDSDDRDYENYNDSLDQLSLNDLKNKYLLLVDKYTSDSDYLKEIRIIKGIEIDKNTKI
jgi:hypothetical protein